MRNLKKFLALLMAMVMTFSLMLTANAKTTGTQYTDVDSVTEEFVEAVDVLTGMKVFQGDAGAFRPASNITRGEVAAIIYRLATGDTGTDKKDLYTTTHPFTDVGENDWFAPYVGYCWNAEIIKGKTETTFAPYDNVTGYEVLAMILRAMGYDQNGEFTGPNWIINVSSIATQRDLLKDVKSTHYGNTLHLASRRDVVASILFQAAQRTRVKYTPAYGYQTGDHTSGAAPITDLYDDYSSLGWLNFGLVSTQAGVVIGNQQTGEKNTRLGFGGTIAISDPARQNGGVRITNVTGATPYTYADNYTGPGVDARNTNDFFNVGTGIDLMGHNVKIWFDGRPEKKDIVTGHPTYAYYDKATKVDVVKADTAVLLGVPNDSTTQLGEAAEGAGFKLNNSAAPSAVFNNSFGKFGDIEANKFNAATNVGIGQRNTDGDNIASPVKLYKLISNAELHLVEDQLDAVISLNIETSQITESNTVNRVPTIGVPVGNDGSTTIASPNGYATDVNLDMTYIDVTALNGNGTRNVKLVTPVNTGVIAKDALVGNSTSELGDYVFGVHISGTKTRATLSTAEVQAINNSASELSYFLMAKVTPDVSGKVVAYNVNDGTVTLENGTVLHRSKYYNTVVITHNSNTQATIGKTLERHTETGYDVHALPQSIGADGLESYNPTTYEFFMDFEGNYLGARRIHDFQFIYGTYLDYEQKLSTSTFTYYLTGVGMDGKPVTEEVTKFWSSKDERQAITNYGTEMVPFSVTKIQADRKEYNVTGTDNLGVPYRDTWNTSNMNYIGLGKYTGFTLKDKSVDPYLTAETINTTDYFVNMERLGVYRAVAADGTTTNGLHEKIVIDSTIKTLGAVETEITGTDAQHPGAGAAANSNLYLTEDTKFIVVDGYGTDSIGKTKVYNGLSELLGTNTKVTLNLAYADVSAASDSNRIQSGVQYAEMTYFTKSPYIYAQSGAVAEKVDVIFLPKLAVETKSSTSSVFYMGDPNYSMIQSHEGTPIYQYTVYQNGVSYKVWLKNAPNGTDYDDAVYADTFLILRSDSVTSEGDDVYTAEFLNNADSIKDRDGDGTARTDHSNDANYTNFKNDHRNGWPVIGNKNSLWISASAEYTTRHLALNYSATTRNAQAATFTWYTSGNTPGTSLFLRVAEANVTNLNTKNAPSGEIWPGITDLATLNEAGSINPVTGRHLKVAAELDPTNPLIVTHIYVCWDQNQP